MKKFGWLALSMVLSFSPAHGQLFQASLKNGDYGGGTAVAPNSGVVNGPDGVTFVSTETSGRSNAIINYQLAMADRAPFRSAGTISFCFRANRATFVSGGIVGENYGYGTFRNGQGSFSASASRVVNGAGDAGDKIALGFQSWHNNVWFNHSPTATFDFDRTYRVGLAWGATPTRFRCGWMGSACTPTTAPLFHGDRQRSEPEAERTSVSERITSAVFPPTPPRRA